MENKPCSYQNYTKDKKKKKKKRRKNINKTNMKACFTTYLCEHTQGTYAIT